MKMSAPFSDIDSDAFQAFEDYLKQNPDVFSQNRRLLKYVTPPSRTIDSKVIDFQKQQLNFYKTQNQILEDNIATLLDIKKKESQNLTRIHKSILTLLRIPSMEELYQFAQRVLPTLLEIDIIDLYLACNPKKIWTSVPIISSIMVNDLFGKNEIIIRNNMENEMRILNESCVSDALLKIHIENPSIIGLLALGSYEENHFESEQSANLFLFIKDIFTLLIERFAQSDTIMSVSER